MVQYDAINHMKIKEWKKHRFMKTESRVFTKYLYQYQISLTEKPRKNDLVFIVVNFGIRIFGEKFVVNIS
jgi:hypothetical protein